MIDVAIYVAPIEPANGGPVFAKAVYKNAYPQLFKLLIEAGARVCLVYDRENTLQSDGSFSQWWEAIISGDKITYKFHDEPLKTKFLYDKHRFGETEGIYVLNPLPVVEICSDKYKSYQYAPDWHPKTEFISDQNQLDSLVSENGSEIVAIKALDSNGGRQVYVGPANQYDKDFDFPLILQEYVETNVGIPGLVEGRHDLRIGLYNGKPIYNWLRQPPAGGIIANISYGGRNKVLNIAETPSEVIEIAKQIDAKFNQYPDRFISIDFANTNKGWKIFEFNCWPGLVDANAGEEESLYMKRLAENLIASAQKYN